MHYPYVPLPKRKPLKWPNGARLALMIASNLEYWERTKDSDKPYYPGGPNLLPGLAKKDTPLGQWLKDLLARAHRNVVIVALANKLARIAWAVLARDRQYVTVQVKGS